MKKLMYILIASLFVSFGCSSDPENVEDFEDDQTEQQEGNDDGEDDGNDDGKDEGEGEEGVSKVKSIKVLQLNTWQEGTVMTGGFLGIVDEIARAKPDFVLLCEIRNFDEGGFIPKLIKELEHRGLEYFGEVGPLDTGTLSKYPLLEQSMATNSTGVKVLKTKVKVDNNIFVLYSGHWDYLHYACYLPRGYDGITWEKMEKPITDVATIEKANKESWRDEAVSVVIDDAQKEKGNIIILGGDFNEPSHLDWTEATKNLWDHNGAVVRWDCSVMLEAAGFKDAYRELYPDPLTHPGFTFPADNKEVPVSKLDWSPMADGRDRIDFVYYLPHDSITLDEAFVLGPVGSIVRGERVKEETEDKFIEPVDLWPTDHKGLIVTFKIK